MPRLARSKEKRGEHERNQLNLFGVKDGQLYRELLSLNPDQLTPLEAIKLLYQWKKMMEEGD